MTRTHPGRNEPCPCGSGRKYKHCHGRKTGLLGRPLAVPPWVKFLIVAAVVLAVGLVIRFGSRATPGRPIPGTTGAPSSGSAAPPIPEPAPYAYDVRTNRHWDPEHRHWHDGPPPPEASRGETARAAGTRPMTAARDTVARRAAPSGP